MFKIQEKGKPETAVWLKEDPITIASDGSGQLLLNGIDEDILAKVKITLDNERPYLNDMTFNVTMLVNGIVIPAGTKKQLKHGDILQIGESHFEISNPTSAVQKLQPNNATAPAEDFWRLQAIGNWLDGQVFLIKGKSIIGRDSSCNIVIPGTHLSRRHAEFISVGSKLVMRDLGSSNGSFHNGKQCQEAHLEHGDDIKLDVLNFKVLAPESLLAVENRKAQIKEAEKKPLESLPQVKDSDKNWVTKPTSVGNTSFDPHDQLLAKHIKTQKLTYAFFGIISFFVVVIGVIYLQ